MASSSICRCDEVALLKNLRADEYAEHLVRERVADDGRLVWFRCPTRGCSWVMEFVDDEHQGRSILLRRRMAVGELLEHIALLDPREQAEWTHPEIEFRVPGDDRTYRGRDEAQAYAALSAADPSSPKAQPISLIELDENRALMLGGVSYVRDGVRSEHRPGGWLVAVKDGTISRSLWFDSWDAARRAAGFPEGAAPMGKRIARWAFSIVHRLRPLRARSATG
jgi:hypothetical protein